MCGTPLTAATLHLPGITKEAAPHQSDPSTLGNAAENHYIEGIYKAPHTYQGKIQQARQTSVYALYKSVSFPKSIA
jgi:hypothetical protein